MQRAPLLASLGALAALGGCDLRPSVPVLTTWVPPEGMDEFVNLAEGAHHADVRVLANAFVYRDTHDRLFIGRGHVTPDGYVADALVAAEPAILLSSGFVVTHECAGSATFAGGRWTIDIPDTGDLSVDAHCGVWSGTYAREEATPDPAEAVATAFRDAVSDRAAVRIGEAPCPVVLHSPSTDATRMLSDDRPLGVLDDDDDGREGAHFHLVEVDPGADLPARIESTARYQVLYERTLVVPDARSVSDVVEVTPGRSEGRAWLVDTELGEIVCVGDVDVANGSVDGILIRGASPEEAARRAGLEAMLQIGVGVERAVALTLHAAVREASPE